MSGGEVGKIINTLKASWLFFLIYSLLAVVVLAVIYVVLPLEYASKTKVFVTQSPNYAFANI